MTLGMGKHLYLLGSKSEPSGFFMEKYIDYLKSSHWKKIRNKIYNSRHCCEICGSSNTLNVHHKSYKNGTQKNILGNEPECLLVLLCQNCHYLWHKMFGFIKLRKWKINNIKYHLVNGYSKEISFKNCNHKKIVYKAL